MANRLGAVSAAIAVISGSLALVLGAAVYLRPSVSHPAAPAAQVIYDAPPTAVGSPAPAESPVATATPAAPTPTPVPTPLPASVFIRVPYTPQAPTANWDTTHQEYCEAAATLMVGRYFRGERQGLIAAPEAERAMRQIVDYERATFPRDLDLKLDQVALVGNYFYDLIPTVAPASLDAVKARLASGQPVIIPVMTHGAPGGQKIAPGYGSRNVYHVVLLIGYDAGHVYANDAGFMTGQNWAYSWDVLLAAMDAQTPVTGQGRLMLTFRTA